MSVQDPPLPAPSADASRAPLLESTPEFEAPSTEASAAPDVASAPSPESKPISAAASPPPSFAPEEEPVLPSGASMSPSGVAVGPGMRRGRAATVADDNKHEQRRPHGESPRVPEFTHRPPHGADGTTLRVCPDLPRRTRIHSRPSRYDRGRLRMLQTEYGASLIRNTSLTPLRVACADHSSSMGSSNLDQRIIFDDVNGPAAADLTRPHGEQPVQERVLRFGGLEPRQRAKVRAIRRAEKRPVATARKDPPARGSRCSVRSPVAVESPLRGLHVSLPRRRASGPQP
jgi:hypothetical protein